MAIYVFLEASKVTLRPPWIRIIVNSIPHWTSLSIQSQRELKYHREPVPKSCQFTSRNSTNESYLSDSKAYSLLCEHQTIVRGNSVSLWGLWKRGPFQVSNCWMADVLLLDHLSNCRCFYITIFKSCTTLQVLQSQERTHAGTHKD